MRRDPLRMYFVISMLCPLVVIRYLMSSASSESNSQQLTVDKEKFIWYDSQRFKAMKPPHRGWSSHSKKYKFEKHGRRTGSLDQKVMDEMVKSSAEEDIYGRRVEGFKEIEEKRSRVIEISS
ncbi:hypothetical protein BD560DRAFT_494636 [Blakeslea trispora]|nr:hypothetical protein BD560DRAFT_494636 [Blakeslea trispora]